jgi:hypothetical protein
VAQFAESSVGPFAPLAGSGTYTRPTGALAETAPRHAVGTDSASAYGATGQLLMVSIELAAGVVVSAVNWLPGVTAMVAPTHSWSGLYDSGGVPLRLSADETTAVWTASAVHTHALTSTFTTTYSGLYYQALCIVAGTVPSGWSAVSNATVTGIVPIRSSRSGTTGLTDPASSPNPVNIGALVARNVIPYGYVS